LAVRTACHRGWTAGEDRSEIATLRAGRVRAAMLRFGVGERAEGAAGQHGRKRTFFSFFFFFFF